MNKRTLGWNTPSYFLNHKSAQEWGLYDGARRIAQIRVIPWGGGLKVHARWIQGGAWQDSYFTAGRDTTSFGFSSIQVEVAHEVLQEIGYTATTMRSEGDLRAAGIYLAAPSGGIWPDMEEALPKDGGEA